MTDLSHLAEAKFISEPDRVLIHEGLAEDIIMGIEWTETPGLAEFQQEFDIDQKDYLASEDFYQVVNFTRVIKRKADGRRFGFTYSDAPGNDGIESNYDSNAEANGFDVEWDDEIEDVRTGGVPGNLWVFLPVEPVVFIGYVVSSEVTTDA